MSSRHHQSYGSRASSRFTGQSTAVSSSWAAESSPQGRPGEAPRRRARRTRSSATPGRRGDDYYVVYCGHCRAVGPADHTCVPEVPVPPTPPAPSPRGASVPPASGIRLPPGPNVSDYQDKNIPDDVFYIGQTPGPHAAYRVGDPGTQDSLDGPWPRAVSEHSHHEAAPPSQQPVSHREAPPSYYTGSAAPSGHASGREAPLFYQSRSAAPTMYSDGTSMEYGTSEYGCVDFEPREGEYYPPPPPSTIYGTDSSYESAERLPPPPLLPARRYHTRSRPPVAYRAPPLSSANRTSSQRRSRAFGSESGSIDSLSRTATSRSSSYRDYK